MVANSLFKKIQDNLRPQKFLKLSNWYHFESIAAVWNFERYYILEKVKGNLCEGLKG